MLPGLDQSELLSAVISLIETATFWAGTLLGGKNLMQTLYPFSGNILVPRGKVLVVATQLNSTALEEHQIWSPELYEVGPDEWRAEERHHEFGDGCVGRHRPPPDLCEESLQ